MHPEFELNLITHIFRKLGVSRTTRNDAIFAFVRGTCFREFHTVLSTMRAYQCAYSVHYRAYSLPMLIFSWNRIFYLLINALHYHCVIDNVID